MNQVNRLRQKYKRMPYTLLVLFFLTLAVVLEGLVFRPYLHGFMGNYLCPTLVWALLAGLIYFFPGLRTEIKPHQRHLLRWLALMCMFISILCTLLLGVIAGFGKSPYDRSFLGIIINLVSLGVAVVAVEMARAWLVRRHFSKRPVIGISLIAAGFTLYTFPLNRLMDVVSGSKVEFVRFMGTDFLPSLGQNLLATYLAFLSGPIPAVIYRGGVAIFERLSPVLPSASWPSQTLLNTFAPVLGIILVWQIYHEEAGKRKIGRSQPDTLGWGLTSLTAICIIWFSMGVFSYSPRVILSGSMQPVFEIGDIVIIKEVDGSRVKMGDIIMFPMNNLKVTHRVIAVQESGGNKYFITKGDANSQPEDDPVLDKNVKGKVVMVIPKLGKFTLLMRGKG